ncbi:lipoprotein [Saccharothrix syringae]|uniref:Lipoprotein n=1 Tax=Saccharothrix syringae TaxID=103733 RepID=A0A5Q0GV86_SACSY|nr:lipoprotein [Saccharothrix syringae]QFZ17879.1 hypothetical protein EKG83_10640 [Saccharothrix syringae]
MLRKHVAPLAALFALGALALTACGGSTAGSAPAPTSTAQEQAAGAADGEPSLFSGSARSNKADESSGDLAPAAAPRDVKGRWVQLRAASAGALDPVVVDGRGLTLYRFDKDTAKPSKSNCNGDCAKTWPPVTVNAGGKVFLTGIRKADVGFVRRDDGQLQLTVGGWPVYRFAKDAEPGDTLGQGVGGTWFGVTPDGRKALGAAPQPPATDPAAGPATNVVLFSGKDFDDFSGNNFATSLQGPGCQDVRGTFLSLVPGGSVKLWSEPGCKGTSLVVTDDVRDVTALGFPHGPGSLFFG